MADVTAVSKIILTAQDETAPAFNSAQQGLNKLGGAAKTTGDAFAGMPAVLRGILQPLAAIASFEGLRRLASEAIQMADAYKLLQARLQQAAGSAAGGRAAFAGLVQDATRVRMSIEEMGRGFVRLATSVQELGGSIAQARQLNEILYTTAKVSGVAFGEATAAARQFTQALGSGVLQGDELRSILENNQELARQLAAGLGVSIGELRKMGAEGKLTADVVANALLSRLPEIRAKLKDIPVTVADAFTLLQNELFLSVGAFDKATGSSEKFANQLKRMADEMARFRGELQDGSVMAFFRLELNTTAAGQQAQAYGEMAGNLLKLKDVLGDNVISNFLFRNVGKGPQPDTPKVNLRAIENEMEEASNAGALGMTAAAKRLYGEALKIGEDFLTKQQKITAEFGKNMKGIAAAIEITEKQLAGGGLDLNERAVMEDRLVQLTKLRATAMTDVVKKIAEANAADAKHSGTLKELTANQKAYNSALEQVANIAQAAQEKLDGLFLNEELTKAEITLRKLENSQAWKILTEGQKEVLTQTLLVAAATERLAKQWEDLAEAAGKAAGKIVKEQEDWEKSVKKTAEAFDDMIDKVDANTESIYNMGKSRERDAAMAKLEKEMMDGLIVSMDEYNRRAATIKDTFDRNDAAKKWKADNEAALKAWEETTRAQEKMIQDVSRVAGDFLVDFVNNGKSAFKNLWDSFKQWALRALAEIAARAVVVNLVGAAAGGASGSAAGAVGGAAGNSLLGSATNYGMNAAGNYLFGGVGSAAYAGFTAGYAGASEAAILYGAGAAAEVGAGAAGAVGAGGIAAGIEGGLAAGLAAIPVVGWIALAALIVYGLYEAFGNKGGGPKFGAFAKIGDTSGITGTDDTGRYFTPNQADEAIQKTVNDVNKTYLEAAKALGLTAMNVGFALGFDTDPAGKASNQAHATTFIDGKPVYDYASTTDELGHDKDDELRARLALEAKRMVFAALQASVGDAPKYMQELFASIDVATATSEELDKIIATAQAIRAVVEAIPTLGAAFDHLNADNIKGLIDALGGVDEFQKAMTFLRDNFTTAADAAEGLGQRYADSVQKVTDDFAALGVEMPKTHEGFLDLLASIDTTTEEGQKLYASLVNISGEFIAVRGTAEQVAQTLKMISALSPLFTSLGLASQEALAGVAALVGGFQGLNALMQFVGDNFMTAAQRAENGLRILNEGFARLGLEVPKSHAAFLALLNGIDLTTEAGQELYAGLLQLAPAFIAVNGAVGDTVTTLGNAVNSLHSMASAANAALGGIRGVAGGRTTSPFDPGSTQGLRPLTGGGVVGGGTIVDVGGQNPGSGVVDVGGGAGGVQADPAATAAFNATMAAIEEMISKTVDDFSKRVALRAGLIAEQLAKYEIAVANNPGSAELRKSLEQLQAANKVAMREYTNFTILNAQYGAARAEQLVKLETWYIAQQEALAGSVGALEVLKAIFDEKWKGIIDGTASGVDGTLSELARLQKGLQDWLNSLKISDLSPLTPREKLGEAQQQYESLLKLAQAGDLDALGKITGAADAYLKLAREFFASSQAYTDIFNAIVAQVGALAMPEPGKSSDEALVAVLPTEGKLASSSDVGALKETVTDTATAMADAASRDTAALIAALNAKVDQLIEKVGDAAAMSVSDAEFAGWCKRTDNAEPTILVELKYVTEVDGEPEEQTYYLADRRYRDTEEGRDYLAYIESTPTFLRALSGDRLGVFTSSLGSLEIQNADGILDWMLGLSIDGSEATFYYGDRTWARDDFRMIFTALVVKVQAPSWDRLSIQLKDTGLLLNKSIGGEVKLGGGGPNADEWRSLNFGWVNQIPFKLYDQVNLIYSFNEHYDGVYNDISLGVQIEVRDRGVPVGYTDGLNGTVTLDASPDGEITGSVLVAPGGSAAFRCVSDAMDYFIGTRCGLTAMGKYGGPGPTYDLRPDTGVGAWVDAGGQDYLIGLHIDDKRNVANDLLPELVDSGLCFWAITRDGMFTFGRIRPDAIDQFDDPVYTIREDDIIPDIRIEHATPGYYRYQAYCRKNWVINSDFAGVLTPEELAALKRKGLFLIETLFSGTLYADNPQLYNRTMEVSPEIETLLSAGSGSDSIDQSRLALWMDVRRSMFLPWIETISVTTDISYYAAELGDPLLLQVPRFDYDDGVLTQVVSINIRLSDAKVDFKLIRRKKPVPTPEEWVPVPIPPVDPDPPIPEPVFAEDTVDLLNCLWPRLITVFRLLDINCPPSQTMLPAIALQFSEPNTVQQYDLSASGSSFARATDCPPLGTGTITYAIQSTGVNRPIYCWQDDMMYFLADKTNSVGPVTTRVLVKYDPRTLAIVDESAALTDALLLEDVGGATAWVICTAEIIGIDTTTMTQSFTDGGGIDTYGSGFAAAGTGKFITVENAANPVVCHLIEVTSPTTYGDTPIEVLPEDDGGALYSADDGTYRRKWNSTDDLLAWDVTGSAGNTICVIIDLGDNSVVQVDGTDGVDNNVTAQQPWWDQLSNRWVAIGGGTLGGVGGYGRIVIAPDGTWEMASWNVTDSIIQPYGGFSLGQLPDDPYTLVGWSLTAPAEDPDETFPTTDDWTTPDEIYVDAYVVCIAPRRLS